MIGKILTYMEKAGTVPNLVRVSTIRGPGEPYETMVFEDHGWKAVGDYGGYCERGNFCTSLHLAAIRSLEAHGYRIIKHEILFDEHQKPLNTLNTGAQTQDIPPGIILSQKNREEKAHIMKSISELLRHYRDIEISERVVFALGEWYEKTFPFSHPVYKFTGRTLYDKTVDKKELQLLVDYLSPISFSKN